MASLTGASFIGGARVGSGAGGFRAVNPATGVAIEPAYAVSTGGDVDAAASLAARAFDEYSCWPGVRRAELLRAIAKEMEGDGAAIIERAGLETALPAGRLQSELGRTCNQLRFFAQIAQEGAWLDARIDHADPARTPLPRPDVRSMRRPLGPVAVFGASNFPLAFSVAGGDTASALAAGCPVIVKAHAAHPGTSELTAMAIRRAIDGVGAPGGVFSMLYDSWHDVGLALVAHRAIKAVGFTGSRRAGLALARHAAAREEPVPVFAEMGSVNPIVILEGALKERGAQIGAGLCASVTLGVGQFCTNPGLVLTVRSAATERFIGEVAALVAAAPPGVMLTGEICDSYRAGVVRFQETPGVHAAALAAAPAHSHTAGAALFVTDAATFCATPRLAEELFGPATLVVVCEDVADLGRIAAGLEGQLTASIHATDDELAANAALVRILESRAGRVVVNAFPTGVEVCQAMVHSGPFPATTASGATSVGGRAIERFARPVCYQSFPDGALPPELREANPVGIPRLVDGRFDVPVGH